MSDINSISPNIRDFLLNRNLILADSIINNGLYGLSSGLGQEASIQTTTPAVQPSQDIVTLGDLYRNLNISNNPYQSNNKLEEISIVTRDIGNIGNLSVNSIPEPYGIKEIDVENSRLLKDSKQIRLDITKNNQYLDFEKQIPISIEKKTNISNQKNGYIDETNNLNTGGAVSTQPLDILGSVLNGQGIGFNSQGNLEPNFDIRSSLAGRVLNAAGIINDTPIGVIGGQQLAFHLAVNSAFGLQQETLGNINTNPLSLLQGNNIIVPNFDITVPQNQTGRILDFGARVLGFDLPISTLDDSSSIFANENPVDNISRSNAIISNTGKGQVLALFDNLLANESDGLLIRRYRPPYIDERVSSGVNRTNGIFPDLYVNINKLSLHQKQETFYNEPTDFQSEFEGLGGLQVYTVDEDGDIETSSKFSWEDDKFNLTKKTRNFDSPFTKTNDLLYKTQEMFYTNKMRSLVSGKGSKNTISGIDEISTPVNVGGSQWFSKGSGVLSRAAINGELSENASADEVFCRVWTTFDRYNKVKDLQKHSGLFANGGLRFGEGQSVLDDNGFVRVSPKVNDPEGMKRFMLSIENLAWADKWSSLPDCEKGPGDPLTGTRGRIMWFPPYDINFTDSDSVSLETTNFIGRGEPIYTYNNTERTGTLSFKIIIDHPTYLNELKYRSDVTDDMLISMAAGCFELDAQISSRLSQEEKDAIEVATAQEVERKEAPKAQTPPPPFSFYFPNDVATVPSPTSIFAGYEDGSSFTLDSTSNIVMGLGCTKSEKYHSGLSEAYPDETNFGLNAIQYQFPTPINGGLSLIYNGWIDPDFVSAMRTYMTEQCPACKVKIYAGTSKDGNIASNNKLGLARAANIKAWFEQNIFQNDAAKEKRFEVVDGVLLVEQGCSKNTPCGRDNIKKCNKFKNQCQDLECKKRARKADIEFVYSPEINEIISEPKPKTPTREEIEKVALNDKIRSRFFNEGDYFEKLEQGDSFIYETLKRKIKYFHPSFHSTTPEGFNSRLTFLKQCTRQGPTEGRENIPSNLAFGIPPVCILRVGDFYHTKIIIDNVSMSFDPLVWDLNPEGVGVQPMLCNVDISFKFIGGSSLAGPINKLQNAISFNFFANTEIYDTRADKIVFEGDKAKLVEGASPVQLDQKVPQESLNQSATGSNNTKGEVNQIAESQQITSQSPVEQSETSVTEPSDPVIGELNEVKLKNALYNGNTDILSLTIKGKNNFAFWGPKKISYVVTAIGLSSNKQISLGSGTLTPPTPNMQILAEKDNLIQLSSIYIEIKNAYTKLNKLSETEQFKIKVDLGNGVIKISDFFGCGTTLSTLKNEKITIPTRINEFC